MRKIHLTTGCYYHLFNRGVEKRQVFLKNKDYLRFLQTLEFYRMFPVPMKFSDFKRGAIKLPAPIDQRPLVRIVGYCLMPNHFHLLVEQLMDFGITKVMHRLLDSYTKYFNTKYARVGSLFQGTFQAKFIETEEYLLQVSKYIHRNPRPNTDLDWEYSSYSHYLSRESHPFCEPEPILAYFSKNNPQEDYQSFVEEAELADPAVFDLLIDVG